jgi:hypothetical protein
MIDQRSRFAPTPLVFCVFDFRSDPFIVDVLGSEHENPKKYLLNLPGI